jgi:hypothetical protein
MTTTDLGAPSGQPPRDVTPGTMPAWAVVFSLDASLPRRLLTVSGDTYDGSITATLPADLTGGRYEVVVEGMTDEDYQRIRLPAGHRLSASIHLWWKDSGSGVLADLSRAAGLGDLLGGAAQTPPAGSLVAVVRVDTVGRRAGERRYETVVSGRELVVARLGESVVRGGLCYVSLEAAARGIAGDAGVPVVTHGLRQPPSSAAKEQAADVRPGNALEAMRLVQSQAAASLQRQGLSTAVVRDGVLHLGLWTARDASTAPLPVRRLLDESGGLVAVARGTDVEPPLAGISPAPPARATVTATALGRPDLKPGDIVRIPLPPEDFPCLAPTGPGIPLLRDLADLLGSRTETAPTSPCLVTAVTHRLSARQGFVTVVRASVLRGADDDGWDHVPPARRTDAGPDHDPVRGSVPADRAEGAAGAVQGVARAVARGTRAVSLLVGQIRGHPSARERDGSPPEQTSSDVWYSTSPDDGLPAAVRRLPVTPDHHGELRQVPVVTPFAFGGYGLVLPRYAGARVLLADTGGGRDVVDLGSVWDDGVAPPAQAGDWWLVLPVSLPTDDLAPGQAAAVPRTGDASHDLIDADGRRVVEVTGLTVRVVDVPTSCSKRPDPGETGVVVLESVKEGKAARIVLRSDGSIAITGTAITLDAGEGDITLKAADVKVSVTGTMDVS